MSISSSLYIGTTGVMAQQESMSVISDNIANMSTTGFKSSELLFQNLMSEQLTGATSNNQIGTGVGISSILYNMNTGPLESTSTSTDLAISGYGFFMVSPEDSDAVYYTKAGNFTFDSEGYFRDASGNIVQGYKLPTESILDSTTTIPEAASATIGDIQLDVQSDGQIVSAPEATTELQLMVNLDSAEENNSSSATSAFTALFENWDATYDPPLEAESYAYESSIKIYDSAGDTHVLTAYFDPATADITDDTNGYKVWEYLITMNPDEDASALNTKQGVLMAGTLTFSPSGQLYNMSAFQGTSDDMATWTQASLSEKGYPILTFTPTGSTPLSVSLDFGVNGSGWNTPAAVTSMADLGTSYENIPGIADTNINALSTTNFSTGSSSIYQYQNGYAQGYLQNVSVDETGTIIGNFSNGQSQSLYKIPLADFINPQQLHREGGNIFSATKDSGAATIGWAGDGRLGEIASSTLEQSNVDLATEFVSMITTQKAFDANSKVITTADQVVQTALAMKK